MELSKELLDQARWSNGAPSERLLVSYLAGLEPEAAAEVLRRMLGGAIAEIASDSPNIERLQACGKGAFPLIADDWCFPGGDFALDAIEAIESSRRLAKATIKSLGHALAAAQLTVGAVEDYQEYCRDPDGWRARRERVEMDPRMVASEIAREREMSRAKVRAEIWRRLLGIAVGVP